MLQPCETRLRILDDVGVYNPEVPVSSHLYRLTINLGRHETDVLAGVEALVEYDSVVVIDEVRHRRQDLVHFSDLESPVGLVAILRVEV